MKFYCDLNENQKCGLVVKKGLVDSVAFFWDEDKDAASYVIELYRMEYGYANEGFFVDESLTRGQYFKKAGDSVLSYKLDDRDNVRSPLIINGRMAFNVMSKIQFLEYSEIKPICSIRTDRNRFFTSVQGLPQGNYICLFKIEDRLENVLAVERPYYFRIGGLFPQDTRPNPPSYF